MPLVPDENGGLPRHSGKRGGGSGVSPSMPPSNSEEKHRHSNLKATRILASERATGSSSGYKDADGDDLRAVPMDPTFVVDDNTLVVLERFKVLD